MIETTGITTYKLDKIIELYIETYIYNEYRDRIKTRTLYKKKRTSLMFLRGLDRYSEDQEYYQGFVDAMIRYDSSVDKNMVVVYGGQDYEIVFIGEEGRKKYLRLRLKLVDN